MNDKVIINLSQDQALVLWELLYRVNSQKILNNFFEDQAEQRILWDLEGILEKNTSSIISWDYLKCLEKARFVVRDKD